MNSTNSSDSRYPYTYACDFIRSFSEVDDRGVRLSRAEASRIRTGVAEAIGMKDDALARLLADHYLKNQDIIGTKQSAQLLDRIISQRKEMVAEQEQL